MQQAPALRFHSDDCGRENPDEWLELVTADNLFPEKEAIGLAGDTTGFSLLDVGTGWCDVSPAQQKIAGNAIYALLDFAGPQYKGSKTEIKSFYSDGHASHYRHLKSFSREQFCSYSGYNVDNSKRFGGSKLARRRRFRGINKMKRKIRRERINKIDICSHTCSEYARTHT